METPTPQPPTTWIQYVLYVLALPVAGSIGLFFKSLITRTWNRHNPTELERAEVQEKNWNVAEKVLHRMDSMQAKIEEQAERITELEEIERKYKALKPYSKRCEDRLRAHKIELPERWESSDDLLA